MKNSSMLILLFALIAGTWTFESCGGGEAKTPDDSVEAAKQSNDSSNLIAVDEVDSKFAIKAADGGMAEVEMGTLGTQKAVNPSVKEFAAMIVADHNKANAELKALATTKSITLPAAVGEEHQEHLTKLSQTKEKDFDKEFIDAMIDGHQKTIDLFEAESKDGKDADIKAFATNTLPTLRSHLDAVKALKSNLKK